MSDPPPAAQRTGTGYDLAIAINPPDAPLDLPSQIDPRGLLTFGFGGLALVAFAPLARGTDSPAIVVPAALAGFVLSPICWVSLCDARPWPPCGSCMGPPALTWALVSRLHGSPPLLHD